MKKASVLVLALVVAAGSFSCSAFKKKISFDDLVKSKAQIDNSGNPAARLIIQQDLGEKIIVIKDVLVKDITISTNIDYDFCIIADLDTTLGRVECFIYTRNIKKISKLVKGETRIDVTGEFGKFFTMLDEYYTKVEIVKASIAIRK